MSLITCRECKHDVSTEAPVCPHCGATIPKPQYTAQKSSAGPPVLLLFIGLIIIGWIGLTYAPKSTQSSAKADTSWMSRDNSTLAYFMMEDYVESRLKSPSTATFPSRSDRDTGHIKKLGNGKYTITSWVDSQNSFGAMVRTFFAGEIHQISSDRWRLVALEFVE